MKQPDFWAMCEMIYSLTIRFTFTASDMNVFIPRRHRNSVVNTKAVRMVTVPQASGSWMELWVKSLHARITFILHRTKEHGVTASSRSSNSWHLQEKQTQGYRHKQHRPLKDDAVSAFLTGVKQLHTVQHTQTQSTYTALHCSLKRVLHYSEPTQSCSFFSKQQTN